MRDVSLTLLALLLAACGGAVAPQDLGDAHPDLVGAAPLDLASADWGGVAPDLTALFDASVPIDLTDVSPDQGASSDLATTADLATTPDLATTADLATPPDLLKTADLATTPDLVKTPDLFTPPDLVSVPPPLLIDQPFATSPLAAWPSPWTIAGGVALADVVGNRGRLRPSITNYSLARVAAPLGVVDAEATYRVRFANPLTSGIGFYLRSNGGHLQTTTPHGRGYAVFVEGFRGDYLGLWREIDGTEIEISHVAIPTLVANTDYRVRFVVQQLDANNTQLRAKLWPAANAEPSTWTIEAVRNDAVLQNVSGGAAFDCWSISTPGGPVPDDCFVDDIQIRNATP